MSKPKLTYFDAPVSRGEECRIALHLAGVDFDDRRIKREEWAALKPTTPFGSMPTYEVEGKPVLAQSNAILTLIGRQHGLHPTDLWEAARHEAILEYCEELRAQVSPTLRIADEAEKKKAREALATNVMPVWGANVERQLGDGPFLSGAKIHVADVKLFIMVRWFANGTVDHIPATVFAGHPKLMRHYAAMRDDARVSAWTSRF